MAEELKRLKKDIAREFYSNRQWPKISFSSFYQQTRLLDWLDWEIKITPKKLIRTYKKKHKWQWVKELERYDEQPWPKASDNNFRQRLKAGYPKEQAILDWDERLAVKRERVYGPCNKTPYVPTYTQKKQEADDINPDDYRIDITYSKEEAEAFRKEYYNLIEETELRITKIEDKQLRDELEFKLDLLNAQLDIFNSYNPK